MLCQSSNSNYNVVISWRLYHRVLSSFWYSICWPVAQSAIDQLAFDLLTSRAIRNRSLWCRSIVFRGIVRTPLIWRWKYKNCLPTSKSKLCKNSRSSLLCSALLCRHACVLCMQCLCSYYCDCMHDDPWYWCAGITYFQASRAVITVTRVPQTTYYATVDGGRIALQCRAQETGSTQQAAITFTWRKNNAYLPADSRRQYTSSTSTTTPVVVTSTLDHYVCQTIRPRLVHLLCSEYSWVGWSRFWSWYPGWAFTFHQELMLLGCCTSLLKLCQSRLHETHRWRSVSVLLKF